MLKQQHRSEPSSRDHRSNWDSFMPSAVKKEKKSNGNWTSFRFLNPKPQLTFPHLPLVSRHLLISLRVRRLPLLRLPAASFQFDWDTRSRCDGCPVKRQIFKYHRIRVIILTWPNLGGALCRSPLWTSYVGRACPDWMSRTEVRCL